jgi:hypothetical protein
VIRSDVEAVVDSAVLSSIAYPRHTVELAVTVTGLDSVTSHKTLAVAIDGTIATRFEPSRNRR